MTLRQSGDAYAGQGRDGVCRRPRPEAPRCSAKDRTGRKFRPAPVACSTAGGSVRQLPDDEPPLVRHGLDAGSRLGPLRPAGLPGPRTSRRSAGSRSTCRRMGLFSGVSLKVEYTGDRFRAERSRYADLPAPFPVNAGMVWRPLPWIEAGAAFEQGHAAMLRASLMLDAGRLDSGAPAKSPPPDHRSHARQRVKPRDAERRIQTALRSAGMPVQAVRIDDAQATVWLDSVPDGPPARTAGRVARIMAARSPADVERLTVVLGPAELAGSAVSFLRADLERADRHAGSPAEIWRTAELDRAASAGGAPGLAADRWQWQDHAPAGAVLKRTNQLPRLPDDARLRDGDRGVRAASSAAPACASIWRTIWKAGWARPIPGCRWSAATWPAMPPCPATVDHLYMAHGCGTRLSDWHTRISGRLDGRDVQRPGGGSAVPPLRRPLGGGSSTATS